MILLEGLGAYGALKGTKMNGKILGISFVTIVVAVVFYFAGVKFPGIGQKALGAIGQ